MKEEKYAKSALAAYECLHSIRKTYKTLPSYWNFAKKSSKFNETEIIDFVTFLQLVHTKMYNP